MSVTTGIPDLIQREEGIATGAELEIAWTALADVDEEVLSRLIERASQVLIAAYEQPHDVRPKVDVDHELVSHWLYWSLNIEGTCESLLEKAGKLKRLTENLSEIAHEDGVMNNEPPFNVYGNAYEPSREALELWGLLKPKDDDAS